LDAKKCSRMNTRSDHEYTMFAPAQLLRSWREQRPSSQCDLDSSVTGVVGRVYYTGVDPLLISFLCNSSWLLLGCVLNGTAYTYGFLTADLLRSAAICKEPHCAATATQLPIITRIDNELSALEGKQTYGAFDRSSRHKLTCMILNQKVIDLQLSRRQDIDRVRKSIYVYVQPLFLSTWR
jgi:hypothetical protein